MFKKTFLATGALLGLSLFHSSEVLAQTKFSFNATYHNTFFFTPIKSQFPFNTSVVSFAGTSSNAALGLKNIRGITYSQVNLLTGEISFNTDPTLYNLTNFSSGLITFEGLNNSIFGTDKATGALNFDTLEATILGTFTLTGGTGQFQGATGVLNFAETNQLAIDPTKPSTGKANVNGVFQTQKVPEAKPITIESLRFFVFFIFLINIYKFFKSII
jgi:hypothetical protein